MTKLRLGPRPSDFIWASGIEDTFVPQTRLGHRSLDEYELIGHYDHWREDLALLPASCLQAARWGVPWYKVEPERGQYDWTWTDQVIPYLIEELHITPIIDLMHYGCPLWLTREFANEDYPRAVAAYAGQFARRYALQIKWYTPLNEPLVNALMCGKRGVWPPYMRGDRGYVHLMIQIVKGVLKTVEEIKSINESAIIVQVEATGLSRAIQDDLQVLAIEDQRRGYLFFDLIAGMVGPDHALFGWLLRNGASPDDLAKIARQPLGIDVMGMNFYPQWSTREVYLDNKGKISYRSVEQEGQGFASLIEDYHQRYQAPVLITETSAYGPVEVASRWMAASIGAVKELRSKGIPVLGYTWFPLFTMVDWRYRLGRHPPEHYYLDLGLYRRSDPGSVRRWKATPLVEQLRQYISNPEEAVGELRQ